MLGGTNGLVPKHLRNAFDRDVVVQRDGCSERVIGNMEGEFLVDFADIRDFLKVGAFFYCSSKVEAFAGLYIAGDSCIHRGSPKLEAITEPGTEPLFLYD